MKKNKHFLYPMIIAWCALIPVALSAQTESARIVEKHTNAAISVRRYSETPYARQQRVRAADPAIAEMVSAINADTLRVTLQELQNWGSRFLMNDNRKEIATTLMNKFLSYGYTDVKLDSFYLVISGWAGLSDSAWQYNVVCTLPGSSAPEEIYVIGGHWDSICFPDPYTDAPGADDNGTAVAATLEVARVMKKANYQPEMTIQFTLFAAEELGLFGSHYAAGKAWSVGEDIRYMLNLDMISNNPENLAEVKVYRYQGFEWAGYCAADAIERYTDLSPVFPEDLMNDGSDSFPYWLNGFPSAYFEEIAFSPNWHKPSDTLGNCNVPYLAEVTGGALATIAEQQKLPYPQGLKAQSTKSDIVLSWKPTKNSFIKGVNVYRSEISGAQYEKITSSPLPDSVYHDLTAEPNKQFYYVMTTVNDSLEESLFSNEVYGARFSFTDTLLVLANLSGNATTPDSIRAFYDAILDTIPYTWYDINDVQTISMAMVSRYRSILWMSNTIDFELMNDEIIQCSSAHTANGGNLLFAGFTPAKFWMSPAVSYPSEVPEQSLFYDLFKVDSIDKKFQCLMFRANAVLPDYDTLNVDSLKYMDDSHPGELYNVDVFTPSPAANIIYRLDTHFDSTSAMGKMKHRPVGLEYMGSDHKSILLSFPLYYLDTADARNFMQYVMREKFTHPVGIPATIMSEQMNLQVYPNPAREVCNLGFTLKQSGRVRISLTSIDGKVIAIWLDRKLDAGAHYLRFSLSSLAVGLYQVKVQCEEGTAVSKIIRQH